MTRSDPDAAAFATISAASFAGAAVPQRRWLIPDLIPDRNVTLLGGDGAVGKGLLAAQLCVAIATQTEWIGMRPAITGPTLHLSAEDDGDEMHRRLSDIVAGSDGMLRMDDLTDVHLAPLAGRDAILASTDGKGVVTPSKLWESLRRRLRVLQPRLLTVENLADVFAGNEISRSEARQFVGLLRQAAVEFELAVLLLGHPSQAGMSSGAGTSGSTAWNNSVRSRLYLDRIRGDDGKAEPDPDVRSLTVRKANYAAAGAEVRMRYARGRFVAEGIASVGAFSRRIADRDAETVFLDMLAEIRSQGRELSHKRSPSYAPTQIAGQPGCAMPKRALEGAMNRLLKDRRIRIEEFGPPSRRSSRIVVAE